MKGRLLSPARADDLVVLYWSSIIREEPTYHEPAHRRPLADRIADLDPLTWRLTLCGLGETGARTIQRRHAVQFARPCLRCQQADPQEQII